MGLAVQLEAIDNFVVVEVENFVVAEVDNLVLAVLKVC